MKATRTRARGSKFTNWLYGWVVAALAAAALALPARVGAQGVTTGSIVGRVTDASDQPVVGASVIAVHVPSNTSYGSITRADGRFAIPNMRVGGPYRVTVSHIGFQAPPQENVFVNLGTATDLRFTAQEKAVEIAAIVATVERSGAIISSQRTGASTQVSREALADLPTIAGRIESVTRLSPQMSGSDTMSFAGQDPRLNNITVDGSYFNNSFGLGNTPGSRTGVAPISLDAIEQIQVNVAPFDVRQGNFVGAAVNMVTRSGTNSYKGSLDYSYRNQSLVGTQAGPNKYNPGTFSYYRIGGWLSGPIVKDRLFFFANFEHDPLTQPGTTFQANPGNVTPAGSITRVRAASLDSLSQFLQTNFKFNPGPYQGYNFQTPATRGLFKLDYNVNDANKVSLRFNLLNSSTDVLLSNSSSLGFGTRRSNLTGLNFAGSNYTILENIKSVIGEWNSTVSGNMSNSLIAGYTYQDESRGQLTKLFPFVDILESGSVYTSFGSEPFTPDNELRYGTYQLQDNFSIYANKHTLTLGVTGEKYHSDNDFFPGSQSVYVYNSLADFYADANDYLAHPNRTTSPVQLRTFQVRWGNIPGMSKPLQPLDVFYAGAYLQDEWRATRNLKLTAGLRFDVPNFGATGFDNAVADTMHFRDENGNTVQYNSGKLPDANILFAPRLGFNWDVLGDKLTQVRGGTGVFTGPPAYVWISNQVGNTGVLTGFESVSNTTAFPFNPNPDAYKPTTVTGAPASSFELALTDKNFKFPQVWRSDLAVDQALPFGLFGTGELIYNRDVNGIYYINADLPAPQAHFNGPDNRPRWTSNKLYSNVSDATVLKNESTGRSWNIAVSLERPFSNNVYLKAGYDYGVARNTVDPGSIAYGSWQQNPMSGDPNNPGLGYSFGSPGHRLFGAATYRRDWSKIGATTLSVFAQSFTQGNTSYTFSGDLNGDGSTTNDLIYIPRDQSEMNFQPYTQAASGSVPARTFSAAEQAAAWDAYINQDPYLSKHRGQYAQRNAFFLPAINQVDLTVTQDLFHDVLRKRNGIQLRADILNLGNLINHNWGVGTRLVNNQPLIVPSGAQGGPVDSQGRAQYRLRAIINGQTNTWELMNTTFQPTAGLTDVYRLQFGLRYSFE